MMHKLRRKKSSQDISSTAVAAAVAAAARPSDSSATATPLYARFAIGHKHSDAAAATAKAVVSEPMALGGAGRARREVGARRERSTRQRKDSGASGDRDSVRAPSRTAAVGPMHVNAPENRQLASSSASAYARARAQSASSGSPAGAREGLQQKSASSLKAAPLPVRSSGESAPPTPPKHPSPGAVLKSSPRRVRPPYLPDDTPTPSLSSASAYASTLGRPYNASATPPHKRPPGSDNKTSSPRVRPSHSLESATSPLFSSAPLPAVPQSNALVSSHGRPHEHESPRAIPSPHSLAETAPPHNVAGNRNTHERAREHTSALASSSPRVKETRSIEDAMREQRGRTRSTTAHAHGLPTPPASSTSSIQSPPTQMAPPAALLSSAPTKAAPRRKYSLLAAFGPLPSRGKEPLPPSAPAPDPRGSEHDLRKTNAQPAQAPPRPHASNTNVASPQPILAPAPSTAANSDISPPPSASLLLAHTYSSSSPNIGSPKRKLPPHAEPSPSTGTVPAASPQPPPKDLPKPTLQDPAMSVFSPQSRTSSLSPPPLAKLKPLPAHEYPLHPDPTIWNAAYASPTSPSTREQHAQYHNGPVRGRPLIFAAMSSSEPQETYTEGIPSAAGRPLIFAAMATEGPLQLQSEDLTPIASHPAVELGRQRDVEPEPESAHNGTFVHGYPTPRSPSPPLPEIPNADWSSMGLRSSVDDVHQGLPSHSMSQPETPSPSTSKQKVKHGRGQSVSPAPDHDGSSRPRKLSKSNARAVRNRSDSGREHVSDDAQADPSTVNVRAEPVSRQAAPVDMPTTGGGDTQLGSPIQLRQERSASERPGVEQISPTKREPSRSKRSERDGNGIKVLTERQLEKLHSRLANGEKEDVSPKGWLPAQPPTPISPDEYAHARSRRRGERLEKARPADVPEAQLEATPPPEYEPRAPTFYPLARHLADPALLPALLPYLSFCEWCAMATVSKAVWVLSAQERELRECVLERYLRTVGYARWSWPEPEPLVLSLQDLNAYMRGVSMPTHQYARLAVAYLRTKDPGQADLMRELAAACRAYTRIVLRLRAQAEAEVTHTLHSDKVSRLPSRRASPSSHKDPSHRSVVHSQNVSRSSSRAPSPTSSFSHVHGNTGPGQRDISFHSPLFRPRRAPLLQVFVPSPEGDWLSDAGVLECEAELKRAGVLHLMRAGDVVWDTAVGDEGNIGRMVWDGGYLIDLDYTYSRTGDLPHYLPTLAFAPSYFHRVIRTMGSGNPICHVDISPWAEEIAAKLQLLQDRMKTETPQGGHHTVVRWVHRSSFVVRPPPGFSSIRIPVPPGVAPGPKPHSVWAVDPGWYGTVVVEAEGTNEGLADLQARCRGAFPPRAVGSRGAPHDYRQLVFRILRERSRPGEIWIRTVRDKERLLPP